MTMSDERIERAARAIAKVYDSADGESWNVFAWQFREAARAALEAGPPEIAAAELRGRIEGLKEARQIADELDPGNGSAIERDMNEDRDNELIVAIDACLASLQPEVAKREEGG